MLSLLNKLSLLIVDFNINVNSVIFVAKFHLVNYDMKLFVVWFYDFVFFTVIYDSCDIYAFFYIRNSKEYSNVDLK